MARLRASANRRALHAAHMASNASRTEGSLLRVVMFILR